MKYRFQMKNGTIYEGYTEIEIKNFIAEIEESKLTPATELVIESHGGLLEEEIKTRRKVKPVKWETKEVKDDSTSS